MNNISQRILGRKGYQRIKKTYHYFNKLKNLIINFTKDFLSFYKHSHVFKTNNFYKIESELILDYHGLEKGFLHTPLKPMFAKNRVVRMLKNLNRVDEGSSQVSTSINILLKYYDYHKSQNIDIEEYFPRREYISLKTKEVKMESTNCEYSNLEYFNSVNASFDVFSNSRKSIRNFDGTIIANREIEKVINLARNAPSVCNRQPSKVYLVNNKVHVEKILALQGGLTGFTETINQVLVLTASRNYFFSVGERNQLYIDGGIFLMNLLYSLHYYKIAACPANWGKEYRDESEAKKLLAIPDSEKILCIVAIGRANKQVLFTPSTRRKVPEILRIID